MKLKVKKLGPFGLMFRPKPKIPVLVALDGHGITTWFVFYPIRAVFLDKDYVIIDVRWQIKPFSIYRPRILSMHESICLKPYKPQYISPAFVIESRVNDSWLPALGERVDLEIA